MTEDIVFSAKEVFGSTRYRLFKKPFKLHDISFELPAGYIMGIIGKNGAGKTTFFDYIMNEKCQYAGCFKLAGRDIHEDHVWTLDNVGFVSEKNRYLEQQTALLNARMLGRFYSNFDMDLFSRTLEDAGVSARKTVAAMSRGEQVKFQLAFAVAHSPKLYLLDEATAGMDPVFRADFFKMLHYLLDSRCCSIIMSSHIEEDIEKHFDYIGCFENGRFSMTTGMPC